MGDKQESLAELKDILARVRDLESAAAVLEWDQETFMPPQAVESRAHQIGTVRQLAHEMFVGDRVGELLDVMADEASLGDDQAAALVRVTRRDYARATCLPPTLVSRLARASAMAKEAWKEARETDRFETFAPHLAEIVELNIEKAESLGYTGSIYDPLLDEFEPEMTMSEISDLFSDLRSQLVPVVDAISNAPDIEDNILRRHFSRHAQWDFGIAVIRDFGYDFGRGRQDVSAHPFTTTFSIDDVRLTTRIEENFFPSGFFGTLHEAGHGLYEQGIHPSLARTPLASGTSLGMHESQSRLWENLVGRSRSFWRHYFPALRARFPEALGDVSEDQFYRAINRVAPSPIRVEADEVTYNLHIMLRFEIEVELLTGKLDVKDVPDAWNDKMNDYLGIRPSSDAVGALQDIHWSLGAFGYFPTYTLGNLMSAQLFDQMSIDLPNLTDDIERGAFGGLLDWLRENVHRHGRSLSASHILQEVCGTGLSAEPWLEYVRRKFGELYGPLPR
ncbi:MAG: carboxypeptidase M32 [Rhodothermales bacterium]|nr:carboxypeptidase M32 [Rhodothermales bacterium]